MMLCTFDAVATENTTVAPPTQGTDIPPKETMPTGPLAALTALGIIGKAAYNNHEKSAQGKDLAARQRSLTKALKKLTHPLTEGTTSPHNKEELAQRQEALSKEAKAYFDTIGMTQEAQRQILLADRDKRLEKISRTNSVIAESREKVRSEYERLTKILNALDNKDLIQQEITLLDTLLADPSHAIDKDMVTEQKAFYQNLLYKGELKTEAVLEAKALLEPQLKEKETEWKKIIETGENLEKKRLTKIYPPLPPQKPPRFAPETKSRLAKIKQALTEGFSGNTRALKTFDPHFLIDQFRAEQYLK